MLQCTERGQTPKATHSVIPFMQTIKTDDSLQRDGRLTLARVCEAGLERTAYWGLGAKGHALEPD